MSSLATVAQWVSGLDQCLNAFQNVVHEHRKETQRIFCLCQCGHLKRPSFFLKGCSSPWRKISSPQSRKSISSRESTLSSLGGKRFSQQNSASNVFPFESNECPYAVQIIRFNLTVTCQTPIPGIGCMSLSCMTAQSRDVMRPRRLFLAVSTVSHATQRFARPSEQQP